MTFMSLLTVLSFKLLWYFTFLLHTLIGICINTSTTNSFGSTVLTDTGPMACSCTQVQNRRSLAVAKQSKSSDLKTTASYLIHIRDRVPFMWLFKIKQKRKYKNIYTYPYPNQNPEAEQPL